MTYYDLASKVTVIIKSEDSTYRKDFLNYDPISIRLNDEVLCSYIKEALKDCGKSGDDEEIRVKIDIAWN